MKSKELRLTREEVVASRVEVQELRVLLRQRSQQFHDNMMEFYRDISLMRRVVQANGNFPNDFGTQRKIL